MVTIPAGSFRMGDIQGVGLSRAEPVHDVTIAAFATGTHEVTFAEYDKFAEATGRSLPDDEGWGRNDRPVINVSWHDAQAYAEWLSGQTSNSYRLPTEAEWEYAARAGTETRHWWGDDVDCSQADYKYDQCNSVGTSPVGSYDANPFGLYDVHGNVWEWTEDCWHSNYNNAPTDGSAWEDEDRGNCGRRVLRGASWDNTDPKSLLDVSNRSGFFSPNTQLPNVGFRLVQN